MSYVKTTSTDTTDCGPMMLWRFAGVLAIIGGASFGLEILSFITVFGVPNVRTFAYVPAVGLAVAGGALAVQGKRAVAPWLILAATIFCLIFPVASDGGILLPWETIARFGDYVEVFGFLSGSLFTMSLLAPYILAIAAIMVIIAFVKTPAPSPNTSDAGGMSGVGRRVASVGEDGTVAADWYADPDGKPAERFWDGSEWTERTRPVTTATAQAIAGGMSKPTVTPTGEPISPNSRAAAAILCWFFGILGVHRFYVGKVGTGLVMLFTLGGLGIWALIDFIWILVGTFKDKSERVLANW